MDEDGFTEVKKKGGQRKQGTPAGGRTSSHAQQKRHGNQQVGGRRGAQAGRSTKSTQEHSTQQGRGKTVQSKPNPAVRQPQPAAPRPAAGRISQASVPAGNLVSSTKAWSRSRSPRKEQIATPPSHRRVEGLCFAQVLSLIHI